ncbi:mitochondrial carrier domain-containing protein [Fimicolochytrium jonesii]|uniref:mitochondrial carrier domain-containing protein n=1 Tax=Fimicolochytrium jonesii TaxID=1396493 RepID=UPI0022FEF3E8|nr:mitochondrial carrier domain-containing protein [Fimicolochytrium jonesii]KAI8817184.1 mitochondrial carrier domain-containing protein [Fimicolochytrium jonesii]
MSFGNANVSNHFRLQDGVIKIVRYEGLSSLWRGLSPTLIMSIPSTVIYYTGYEHIRDLISAHLKSQNQDQWAPLLAGATARTLAATAISPIELLRTRMQSTSSLRTLSSALTNIRAMVRDAGWIALWRGLTPTLWRDVPFSAVYWIGYEGGKKWLDGLDGGSSPSGISETGGPWSGNPPFTTAPQSPTTPTHAPVNTYLEFRNAFLAGATSGTLAALITTPFDVAKTLQQAAQHPPSTKHHPISVPSTMEVMRGIVRREGWRGLFRGVSPRIAKVAPACAVMISSYEVGKKIFERSNNHPA